MRRRNEATERSRTSSARERGDERQAAALLGGRGLGGRLRRDHGAHGAAGTTAHLARTVIFIGFGGNGTARGRGGGRRRSCGGARGRRCRFTEALLGDFVGLLLVSSSWRRRSSSSRLRASAASRSACSMPSLLARCLASASAWRRSSASRTRESASALARALRSSSVECAQHDARGARIGGRRCRTRTCCRGRGGSRSFRGRGGLRGSGGRSRGFRRRLCNNLLNLGLVAGQAALHHLLDDDLLGAAMAETLPHRAGIRARLERQGLGANADRFVAGVFRFSHSDS